MQQDRFVKINTLFRDSFSRIRANGQPPEEFARELLAFIQLAETINKLALVHSSNSEQRQISFELGKIIRNSIQPLMWRLGPDFVEKNLMGKKLLHLHGRSRSNFALGARIDG